MKLESLSYAKVKAVVNVPVASVYETRDRSEFKFPLPTDEILYGMTVFYDEDEYNACLCERLKDIKIVSEYGYPGFIDINAIIVCEE